LQYSGLFLAFLSQWVAVISFLFLLLIVLVLATLPAWPYSRSWGFYPSGIVGLVLSVLILMAISGRL
jgi:hypothetical protein